VYRLESIAGSCGIPEYNIGMKILFNPDEIQEGGKISNERRAAYLRLCRQVTSRDSTLDYPAITAEILKFTKDEAIAIIPEEYDTGKKTAIRRDLEAIFAAIPDDKNYIGKINLVCLQCILLFTEHCMDPAAKSFPVNSNDAFFYYSRLKRIDWRNYSKLQAYIAAGSGETRQVENLYFSSASYPKRFYTTNEPPRSMIFLVTILDYLSITEIIETCLDNVILCGMTGKFDYADGRFISPYEFLEHDITHGNNYEGFCFQRAGIPYEDIQSFYRYCVNGHLSAKEVYCMKVLIFFLIHESLCDYFPEYGKLTVDRIISDLTTTSLIGMRRFENLNDLGKIFPKPIQGNPAEIMKFLTECAELYQREFHIWRMVAKKYGGKRRVTRKARRNSRHFNRRKLKA
jgi:hypothetical protein